MTIREREESMAETESKSRSLLAPIIGGLVLIAALVLIIALRTQLHDLISSSSKSNANTIVGWVPDHQYATLAIVVAFLITIAIDWVAHLVGRLRAWIFVLVVEIGLWILFWNSVGIPSLKHLVGLDSLERISTKAQFYSGLLIFVLSGIIFWILEAVEAFKERRARTAEGIS
jgi:hypothetical protein